MTLNIHHRDATDLEVLKSLPHLTQLTLDIGSQVKDLEVLKSLPHLTQLTLVIGSQVKDLEVLKSLPHLTQLTLPLYLSEVKDLEFLQQLNCQSLDLTLNTEQRLSLKTIPKSVTSLAF